MPSPEAKPRQGRTVVRRRDARSCGRARALIAAVRIVIVHPALSLLRRLGKNLPPGEALTVVRLTAEDEGATSPPAAVVGVLLGRRRVRGRRLPGGASRVAGVDL